MRSLVPMPCVGREGVNTGTVGGGKALIQALWGEGGVNTSAVGRGLTHGQH